MLVEISVLLYRDFESMGCLHDQMMHPSGGSLHCLDTHTAHISADEKEQRNINVSKLGLFVRLFRYCSPIVRCAKGGNEKW